MENDIDLIDAYLDKSLTKAETDVFENRLKTDIRFNTVFNEHLSIIKGIERVEVIKDINKARVTYFKGKWIKYFLFFATMILILIVGYNLMSNPQKTKGLSTPQSDSIEAINDSTNSELTKAFAIKNDSVKKYVVVKYLIKTITDKKMTATYGGVEVIRDTLIMENLGFYSKEGFVSQFPDIVDYKIKNDSIVINTNLLETKSDSIKKNQENKVVLKKQKVRYKPLKAYFNSVKKKPQRITFNAEKGYTVVGNEGTKIIIPKDAFVYDKTGKEVKGKVTIELTEYYKLSDILMADLSTKSDEKLLETEGMLYLEARRNNSKLKLKPEKQMQIVFSKKGKTNMQLFYGEKTENNINWKLSNPKALEAEVSEIGFVDEAYTNIIDYSATAIQFIDETPIYPGCENTNSEERKNCMDAAVIKLINRKFNLSIIEDLNLTGKQTIRTSYEIDIEGNIGKIEVRATHKVLAEEAIRVLELMPKLIPGKQDGQPVAVKYFLPINIKLEGETNVLPTITLKSDRAFVKELEEKPISEVNNVDLERYTFATSNLGWINCDRFTRSKKKKIKYKLKIKDAEGANIKMIFKSISSILPSNSINNQFDFGEVPVDEDVVLLAIKKEGHQILLGKKEVTTKEISELNLNFKQVTLDELKVELIKMNPAFK